MVADSTLIRLYLEQQHGIDFDRGLSARERGIGWAAEKMLEDHLYWVMIYWRWLNGANFDARPQDFLQACAGHHPAAGAASGIAPNPRATCTGTASGGTVEIETTAMAERGIEALAQILGDNRYFLGATPTGADATVFAFVAGALAPHFESPVRDKMQSMENLVAYRDRMMAEYFPEFARSNVKLMKCIVVALLALQIAAPAVADSFSDTRVAYLAVIDRPRAPLKAELAELPPVEGLKKFHLWFSAG